MAAGIITGIFSCAQPHVNGLREGRRWRVKGGLV